jgi:hypothetical protein
MPIYPNTFVISLLSFQMVLAPSFVTVTALKKICRKSMKCFQEKVGVCLNDRGDPRKRISSALQRPWSDTGRNAPIILISAMEGIEVGSDQNIDLHPPHKKARAAPLPQISTVNGAAPPSPLPSPHGSPSPESIWPSAPPSGATSPLPLAPLQPYLLLTTLLTLPSLLSHFITFPAPLQSHFLLILLRRSPLPVISTLHAVLTPTLARDFLTLLPLAIVSHVSSYLPFSTLARASRV